MFAETRLVPIEGWLATAMGRVRLSRSAAFSLQWHRASTHSDPADRSSMPRQVPRQIDDAFETALSACSAGKTDSVPRGTAIRIPFALAESHSERVLDNNRLRRRAETERRRLQNGFRLCRGPNRPRGPQ